MPWKVEVGSDRLITALDLADGLPGYKGRYLGDGPVELDVVDSDRDEGTITLANKEDAMLLASGFNETPIYVMEAEEMPRETLITALSTRITSLTTDLNVADLINGEDGQLHFLNDAVDLIEIISVAVTDSDPTAAKAMDLVHKLDTEPRDVIYELMTQECQGK